MSYHKTVEQYLEYCKFRKELDWNTLKAYRIDLKQFFEYVREDIPEKAAVEAYITIVSRFFRKSKILPFGSRQSTGYDIRRQIILCLKKMIHVHVTSGSPVRCCYMA